MINTCPFRLQNNTVRVLWEITHRCNLRCSHCMVSASAKDVSCELTDLKRIYGMIDKLAESQKVKEIWISGGEPLLRKDLVPIIKYIDQRKMIPSLSTNAYFITEKHAESFYVSGIRYVHVSLDGLNAETHDSLRGVQGAFDRAVNGLKYLNQAGIVTGASFMVTENSVDQIRAFIDFGKALGLSVISFYQVESLGNTVGKDFGDRDVLAEKLSEIERSVQSESPQKTVIEFPRLYAPEEALDECRGDRFLTLLPNGDMGVCPWLMKSKLAYCGGNLITNSFDDIVMNCSQYISSLKKRRKGQKPCTDCENRSICGQGCPAVSVIDKHHPYGFDYLCKRTENFD